MDKPEKHQCSETVVTQQGLAIYRHRCTRNAICLEDGKWWCKQHAPSTVKARREASSAKYEAEVQARRAKWNRERLAMKLLERLESLNPTDPEGELERLIGLDYWISHAKNHESAPAWSAHKEANDACASTRRHCVRELRELTRATEEHEENPSLRVLKPDAAG